MTGSPAPTAAPLAEETARRYERVLVVAPHPDDEILGVGGTIAKYASQGSTVTVLTVSGHLPPLYSEGVYERTVEESRVAHGLVGVSASLFLEIPATMIGDEPVHRLNGRIYDVVEDLRPQMVLCPYPDRHVDHRLVFDAVMVAARPVRAGRSIELLAAYETLSETHWNAAHVEPNFTPNWVVDITDFIEAKTEALAAYRSQVGDFPSPRSVDASVALAKFRGTQAGFCYGEGLQILRMVS